MKMENAYFANYPVHEALANVRAERPARQSVELQQPGAEGGSPVLYCCCVRTWGAARTCGAART